MNRFIKYFSSQDGEASIEEQVTNYAQEKNLQIVTLTPIDHTSVYVLFEEKE